MVTRRGIVLLAGVILLALVGWPLGIAGWAVAAGDLLAIALIAADWIACRPGAVEVTREQPPPLSVGRANRLETVVHNRTDVARAVLLGDAPPVGAGIEPARAAVKLEPGGEQVLVQTIVPRARGPLHLAPVEVRIEGPLGLAFRERSQPGTAIDVVAAADVIQLREERLLPAGRRLAGMRAIRAEAAGREFESLREYVRGDEYRRISWKATARRGRPIVAMHRPERHSTLVLVLESGRLMVGGGGDGLDKLDRTVNAAVMLAAVAREYGDAVGATVFDDRPRVLLPPASRPAQLRRVVDVLSAVEPALTEPDWARGLAGVGRMTSRRSLITVFSDAFYLGTDPALPALLARLARRHLIVFAAVRDDELSELAARPVVDGASLYERGAATGLLERRAGYLNGLAHAGVHVLDAAPRTLTAELVARFHSIRSSGVL
jgi:uncharacterized protein (DUF58 family)